MDKIIHMFRKQRSLFSKLFLLIFVFTTVAAPMNVVTAATDIGGHWAEASIAKWLGNGIVSGYSDGTFRPDANMTKAEFITVINHIYGFYETAADSYGEASEDNYTDVQPEDWFYHQTAIAKNSAYMTWYTEDQLGPNDKITRQEVCAIIASIQALKASETFEHLSQFSDSEYIPEWSRPYLDACVASGYLSGYPDGALHPAAFITRAEAMTILDRSTGVLISQSGAYGGDGTPTVYEGNLTVNAESVSLKHMTIKGNLILAAGIKQGEVTLENVTVVGKTIVNGGGDHSIIFTSSHLGELLVYKQDGRIHVVSADSIIGTTLLMSSASLLSDGDSQMGSIEIMGQASTVTLEGSYDQISLEVPVQIELTDGTEIAAMSVSAEGSDSTIQVGTQSRIGELTCNGTASIKGEGSIESAVVNVNGVTIEQAVGKLTVANHVSDFAQNTAANDGSTSGGTSKNNISRDTTAPSDYQVQIDQTVINSSNAGALSFHFEQAEVNTTYAYEISSTGGSNVVSGSGTVTISDQAITAVDISTLPDGEITLTAQLTDASGNTGSNAIAKLTKDTVAPTGYSVQIDQVKVNMTTSAAISFTVKNAEIGATCLYAIKSDGGGETVTGAAVLTSSAAQISNVDISTLPDGMLTLAVTLTDSALNAGTAQTATASKDTALPYGYQVRIDQKVVNTTTSASISFTFSNAEVGSDYAYSLTSSGGSETVTGSGVIAESGQRISDIDVQTLADGLLTLTAKLIDDSGNVGNVATDTIMKDLVPPAGYGVTIDTAAVDAASAAAFAFTLSSAEVGATCAYTISSDGGGADVTGSVLLSKAAQQISEIDVSALPDGILTLSVTLSDTALNEGHAVTETVIKDTAGPNGSSVSIDQPYINLSGQTALSFTFSGAESGAQYAYAITSDGGTDTVTGTGVITSPNQQITGIDVSSLSDGTLTLSVKLTDVFGNTGNEINDTVPKDVAMPSGYRVAIDLATVDGTNHTNFAFTVSGAEIGAECAYVISSDGGGTAIAGSAVIDSAVQQVSAIDVHTLPDGLLTLSVVLTDAALNSGAAVTDTVEKDTTSPDGYSVTIDDTYINAGNQNALSFTFNGVEVGAQYAYTITSDSDAGASSISAKGTITSAGQQLTGIDVSTLPDGTLTLSVKLTDNHGNIGSDVTDTVLKDVTAPAGYSAAIDLASVNSSNKTQFAFTLSGAEVGSTCSYAISSDGGSGGNDEITGNTLITSADQQITGIDVGSLSDGILTLSVVLTDTVLNTGAATTEMVTKDTVAPTGYSAIIDAAQITPSNEKALSFTFAGAELGTQYTYTFTSDGDADVSNITGTGTITGADQQITGINVSTLPDGILTLTVKLTDNASNSGISASDTVAKDTTAPNSYNVTIDQPYLNADNKAAMSFTFVGAELGTQYTYVISSDGNAESVPEFITGTGTITSAAQQISGIDVSTLPDGTLTLSVTLDDAALNTGAAVTDTVIKDTVAPAGYSVSYDAAQINAANQTALSFTLSGAALGTQYAYTITSDGGAGSGSEFVTDTGTITSADQQIAGIDVSTLSDGTLTLAVTLTDAASNTGAAASDTVDKDTTAPSGYSASIDETYINAGNQTTMSFTFNGAEVGTQYAYTIISDGDAGSGAGSVTDTGTITSADQQLTGVDVSTLPDGTLTLSVKLTDTFGNVGSDATDTVLKDVVAPAGYDAAIDLVSVSSSNKTQFSFTLSNAEVGSTCAYTIRSDGGGTEVTGSTLITGETQQLSGIDVSALSDGTLTLTAALIDSALNTGNTITKTVLKDTVVPSGYSISIDAAQINSSTQNTLSFTFNGAEIGTQFEYTLTSDGGAGSGEGFVTDTGTITGADQQVTGIDVSTLADGTLTLVVTLTDAASNTGTAASDTAVKDTAAPDSYSVSIDETYINMSNQTVLSFTFNGAELGTQYAYTITSDGGAGSGAGFVTDTGTITSVDQQISGIDVSTLPDGTLTLSVTLDDAALNTGAAVTDTVIKDTSAPAGYSVSYNAAQINAVSQTALSFTLSGAALGTQYAYTITSDGGAGSGSEFVTDTGIITSADQQVTGIDVSTLSDGTLTLAVTLTDAASNTGTAASDTADKDTTAPSGYSASIDETYINSNNQTALSFAFNGAEVGTQYAYTITSDGDAGSGSSFVTDTGTIISEDQQLTGIDVSTLPDGTLTLSVKLTDTFGNVGSDVTDTVLKDVVAPAGYDAAIDLASVNSDNESQFAFTLSNAEVGSTCTYTISSDGGGTDVTGSTLITGESQQLSGIDVSALSDGTLTLTAALIDTALNTGNTLTKTALKDTVVPSGYSVSIDAAQISLSTQDALSFTFAGAELGTQYAYTLTSDGDAGISSISAAGTIISTDQQITGIDVSTLPDGTLTLAVKLTDDVLNSGSMVSDTVAKDTTAPNSYSVVIDQPYLNADNQTAMSFTFASAELGTQYTYTITSDGDAGVSIISATGTITSADQQILGIDVSTLPDGILTLSVTLTDTFDNSGEAVTDSTQKDVLAPLGYSAAIDLAGVENANRTNFTFTLSDAEVGTTCTYSISSDGGGTAITGGALIENTTQQFAGIDVSSLADGTLTLSVILKDTVLNMGAAAEDTVLKDITAPTGYSVSFGDAQINAGNQTTLAFDFINAEVGTQYAYTLTSDGDAGTSSISATGTITSADQQLIGIDVSTLPDGTLTLTAALTDTFNNVGSDVTAAILKDVVAPAGYDAIIDLASVNSDNEIQFAFTLSGAEVGATCAYTVSSDGGGTEVTDSTLITGKTQQFSGIDVSALPDGTLTLTVALTDTALNTGNTITKTVLKDTVVPSGYSAAIGESQINTGNQTALSFAFSGAELGTQYAYTIISDGDAGTSSISATGTITSADQQITGIDVSTLPDGILTLSVYLTDDALNVGTSVTDTVIKDTTAPSGYSTAIDAAYINGDSQTAFTFTFTGAEIGAQYAYTITTDGGAGSVADTGTITSADQQISGIDVSTLSDGTLTLTVKLTDTFGNAGIDVTDTVVKDIAAPSGYGVAIDLAAVNETNDTNFTFTISSAEVGATCTYTVSSDGGGADVTGTTVVSSATEQFTGIDVSTLSDGTLTLAVVLKDAAFNIGSTVSDTVTLDANPPSGYSVQFDQNPVNYANQGTISFTFAGAEIDATYAYTIVSDGGAETVTGSGTINAEDQQVSGIDVTSLAEGTLTITASLTDVAGHVGIGVTASTYKDTVSPAGYSVSIDLASVNTANLSQFAFVFSGAEIGAACSYTISSDGGGTVITGTTAITSESQQFSDIDVSALPDGTITLSVVLTDAALNAGVASTDTVIKDTTAPDGYSVSFYQSNIHPQNSTAIAFNFANAEVGTTYAYTITSSGGGTPVTGTGTVTAADAQIAAINTSGLSDGTITLSCTLTDVDNNIGDAVTDTVRKSPYADIQVTGYDIFYNQDGTASNVPGNGVYTYDQMENGKPSYTLEIGSNAYIIHWYDSGYGDEWNITNTVSGTDYIYYFNTTNSSEPPSGGWYYTNATTTVDADLNITVVTP